MAKLFDSKCGARIVIVSNDHCPPHVHARHRAEAWVVRLWFTYESTAVGVMSIAPAANAVLQSHLNQMLDETSAAIDMCRALWWDTQRTTCLENKWVALTPSGQAHVLAIRRAGARQVRSADYDASTRRTTLRFFDGTEHRLEAGEHG